MSLTRAGTSADINSQTILSHRIVFDIPKHNRQPSITRDEIAWNAVIKKVTE